MEWRGLPDSAVLNTVSHQGAVSWKTVLFKDMAGDGGGEVSE